MGKLKTVLAISIGFLLAITVFGSAPVSAKTIRLTYGSSVSKTHTFSHADIAWIDKIEKETNGQVKITAYWGGSLLDRRENTAELIQGVADLAPGETGATMAEPQPVLAVHQDGVDVVGCQAVLLFEGAELGARPHHGAAEVGSEPGPAATVLGRAPHRAAGRTGASSGFCSTSKAPRTPGRRRGTGSGMPGRRARRRSPWCVSRRPS